AACKVHAARPAVRSRVHRSTVTHEPTRSRTTVRSCDCTADITRTIGTMSSSSDRSQAYRDDRAHVFHSWSAQAHLDPLVITGGEGAWVWDEDDNRFLDFSSQ